MCVCVCVCVYFPMKSKVETQAHWKLPNNHVYFFYLITDSFFPIQNRILIRAGFNTASNMKKKSILSIVEED